ncbi:histidine kinase [Actinoplanes sp. DH11]|uniref:sensor histidine kinase n=1 Tax=Actinoplanes sp. DH11 TaxID=2857011 RepID=UPI001E30412D|nr:histidine kinase [Actinoplanes sp. DH11]
MKSSQVQIAGGQITEATRGRLHRLNVMLILPILAVAGLLVVALDADTWPEALILGLGVVAALVASERWAAGDLIRPRVAYPCLAVTSMVWPFGALLTDSPNAFWGLCVVGSLVVPRVPRHRAAAAVALVSYVALVGAARLLFVTDDMRGDLITYLLVPAGVTVVVTALQFPNERFYDLVRDLEQSRQREAELAVTRERVRFASDLHDIQGHTLHVVKLKIALAQRLIRADPDRAELELREIHGLVSDTIMQTKELAYAQRRLNLSAELENAKNLFEAAGITVGVVRDGEVGPGSSEMLGQVLRETTTNILRHAQATRVRIMLTASGIAIINDGVQGEGPAELRGLATLRRRVAEDGGELTVAQNADEFVTAASFPPGRDRREP